MNNNAKLAAAYVKAYAEIQNVTKNAHNPHFGSNYADLSAVLDVVKPVFEKHELALYQAPGRVLEVGGKLAISVVGILMHSSGEMLTIDTQVPLGDKAGPQPAGGAITYARRYQLAAIGGLAQVDDDGNEASSSRPHRSGGKPYSERRDDLLARIAAFSGKPDQMDAELGPEVQDFNDEEVGKVYRAKKRELKEKGARK